MKRWSVDVPFSGFVSVKVEAETKEDALAAAMESKALDHELAIEIQWPIGFSNRYAIYHKMPRAEVRFEDEPDEEEDDCS